jgi:hypothetical protein
MATSDGAHRYVGRQCDPRLIRTDAETVAESKRKSSYELCTIYTYIYEGIGELGECLPFGCIVARNAVVACPWH